jgi:hypothetical protein
MMSSKVAEALFLLELDVSHVGSAKRRQGATIPKATSDAEVIRRAKLQGRVPVTSNWDFMLAATGDGVTFVWVDGRGRSLTKFDTARMIFQQWSHWERLITVDQVDVVRATRSTFKALTFQDAEEAALKGMARHKSGQRRKAAARANGRLFQTEGAQN